MSNATKDIVGKIVEDILLEHIEINEENQVVENATEVLEKIEETIKTPCLSIDTSDEQVETEIKETLSLENPSLLETVEIEKTKETVAEVAEVINDKRFSICCFFSKSKQL